MAEAEITTLSEEIASLKQQVAAKDAVIEKLQNELSYLRKKVFGHMSEKHLPIDPAQLLLFDQKEMSEEETATLEEEVKKAEETITYSVTRKAKPSRKPLDTSKLPVQETHIYPEGTCDENGNLKPEMTNLYTGIRQKMSRLLCFEER